MDASNFFVTAGAAGLLLMTAIISWKVFGRYVLDSTPSWAEQLALVLMIWYVCFAAAAGVKEGFHIRIVALENVCPYPIQFAMRLFSHGVIGICGLAMCIWGIQLVVGTWSHVVPTLGVPRGSVYIALPVSGALITFFSLEKIVLAIQRFESNPEEKA